MGTIKIPNVKSVSLVINKTNPPALAITAVGEVPTSGYKNPILEPYQYTHAPLDGIWEFTFYIDEPEGIVNEVITEVTANYLWTDYPHGLKGIKVHYEGNSITEMLP